MEQRCHRDPDAGIENFFGRIGVFSQAKHSSESKKEKKIGKKYIDFQKNHREHQPVDGEEEGSVNVLTCYFVFLQNEIKQQQKQDANPRHSQMFEDLYECIR